MVAFSAQDIPNRFDFSLSPKIYEYWESKGFFHSEPDPSREPYTIVIPPPNVTGALHLGHALNNTLQDVLIRYKRLQGFNTLWMPGTDHAGIATQAVVEKRIFQEEKKSRHDLGREELVKRIWKWKDQYETRILSQLKRLGSSCDWERTRFTLDDVCARAVRRTFFDLFAKTWIYKGKRLVNWDTFLQTAVSDDEVFHETTDGNFWHFKYPVIDPEKGEPGFVTIATTRPETMLGDTAVAVHPDPEKALNEIEAELQEKLRSAPGKEKEGIKQQIEEIAERRKTMLPQLVKLRDMALAGRKLMLPLVDREIPLVEMTPETADVLLTLARLHGGGAGQASLVLAVDQQLLSRLDARLYHLAALKIELEPWNVADTSRYVEAYRQANSDSLQIVSDETVQTLAECADGNPQLISRILDLSRMAGETGSFSPQEVRALREELL